jgi:hypothetical protein
MTKMSEFEEGNTSTGLRALPLGKNELESTSYLLLFANKTSFTELYAKP